MRFYYSASAADIQTLRGAMSYLLQCPEFLQSISDPAYKTHYSVLNEAVDKLRIGTDLLAMHTLQEDLINNAIHEAIRQAVVHLRRDYSQELARPGLCSALEKLADQLGVIIPEPAIEHTRVHTLNP